MSHPLSQPWAISEEGLQLVLAVWSRGELFTEAQQRALAARGDAPMANAARASATDGVAVIPIVGPLVRHAGLLTDVSGATSYERIGADLDAALADASVRAIVLRIDSPGGEANGVAELADRIRAAGARKPVTAYVEGYGASAAYWLASASGEVVAAQTAWLGSIGVRFALVDDAGAQDKTGVRRVEIVSSQSHGKRGTPVTDEVLGRLQQRADDLAQLFVAAVADYRGVAAAKVLADFGAGDVLLGAKAVAAGMADRLGTYEQVIAAARGGGRQEPTMEKKDLAARLEAMAKSDPELAGYLRAQAEAAAQAEADAKAKTAAVAYEDLIRQGKADRKICGPAHEGRVRANHQAVDELTKYLASAEPAAALAPVTPAAEVGAELSAIDRRFLGVMQRSGMQVDEAALRAAKARTKAPVVREQE